MTKTQALRAVELIGGISKAASLVFNLNGEPMEKGNLHKAINRGDVVPDWLSVQLVDALNQHKLDVDRLLLDL